MLGTTLRLSQPEAQELHTRARSRVLRADDVRRARLILMLAEGQSWSTIQHALGCSSAFIARWQTRFAEQRLAGLFARHQGRPNEGMRCQRRTKIRSFAAFRISTMRDNSSTSATRTLIARRNSEFGGARLDRGLERVRLIPTSNILNS